MARSHDNAGRHYKGQRGAPRMSNKVRDHGADYGGPYAAPGGFLLNMTKDELVQAGTAAAVAELRRRGRDKQGQKLAWSAKLNGAKKSSSRSAIMSEAARLRAQGMSPREALKKAWGK